MVAQNPQLTLDSLNRAIMDVLFLLNGQEHVLSRILLFRATLSTHASTEAIFATLTSMRVEAERQHNLLTVLYTDLLTRRNVAYRQVESMTRGQLAPAEHFQGGQAISAAEHFHGEAPPNYTEGYYEDNASV